MGSLYDPGMAQLEENAAGNVPYSTSLPRELVEKLRARAEHEDVPQAAIVRRALRRELNGSERED